MTSAHRRWRRYVQRVLFATAAVTLAGFGVVLSARQAVQQPAAVATLNDARIEEFLLKARVVRSKPAAKGITGSLRATLTDGEITHDAHIQMVNVTLDKFEGTGGVEFNFRDSWMLNVAAYRVDRLIDLNMVPVSVSRRWDGTPAAYTWWVDDVVMDEGDRLKKKVPPPNIARWNEQMWLIRMFDELIYNVDRNLGNLLITKDWRAWAIDHTRAFRRNHTLRKPAHVTNCDRQVLQRLKQLERDSLKRALHDFISDFEIAALLARRDAIVTRLESLGPAALFDRRAQP